MVDRIGQITCNVYPERENAVNRLIRSSIAALSIASLALVATPVIANADEPVVDTTPAVVQSISPSSGALVSGTKTFVIKTDEWVSAYVEYNKNGVWKTDNTKTGENRYGSSLNFTVDTTKYGDGVFGLKINLKNKVNLSTNTAATYTVDNTKPSLSWVTPAENAYVRGTVPVTVAASDANPLAYNLRVDSTGLQYKNPWVAGNQSFDWDTTTLADGVHTPLATATDRAGHKTTITNKVIVDNTKPAINVPEGPIAFNGAKTFNISQTEDNPSKAYAEVQQLVNGKWQKKFGKEYLNVNEFDFTVDSKALGLTDGDFYQLKVSSTDKAGNNSSRTTPLTVDNTAPIVAFITPGDGNTISGMSEIKVNLNDAHLRSYNLRVDSAGLQYQHQASNGDVVFDLDTTTLANGLHTLLATATDKFGHKTVTTIKVIVDNTVVTEPEPQPEPPAEEETPVVTTPEEPEQETPIKEDTDETTPVEEESNQDPKPTNNTDGVNTIPAAFVSNPVDETPTKTIAPLQLAATGATNSVVAIGWAGAALALGLTALVVAHFMRRREMVKA